MTDQTAIQVSNSNFIAPVVNMAEAKQRYDLFQDFVKTILKKDHDFGEIPGTKKPTLLKAGAEKLGAFFGIRPVFVLQESVSDWTGKDHGEPFFFREYKCQGYRNGELIGEGIGSCNSWEKKYRYRWMNELEVPANIDKSKLEFMDGAVSEFKFAVDKSETTGKYGKPASYWKQFKDAIDNGTAKEIMRSTRAGDKPAWEIGGKLYAVPNHDPADQVNTIDKMAQKRALVAMILIATNASDYFTQDMEDFVPTKNPINPDDDFIDGQFKETSAAEAFANETGAETGELLDYLDPKVTAMVAKVRGLTKSEAARGLQEWLNSNRIKKEMTLAQFEALAKVD